MSIALNWTDRAFSALNGGPIFKFNEAVSFQVNCETQQEVDYYWEKQIKGGDEQAQSAGLLKDKYCLMASDSACCSR